jgi:hypothetical protein
MKSSEVIKRRLFLTRSLAAGGTLCLGCAHFFSSARTGEIQQDKPFEEKIIENSGMTYEQVFNFAFRDSLILQMKAVAEKIGREKFVEMLKEATDKIWIQPEMNKRFDSNLPKELWSHVLDMKVERSENQRTYTITKCLWAKTFREADAADIGYALWCYGDYAIARSNKEKLEREKTLMQGHDCCILKYTPA